MRIDVSFKNLERSEFIENILDKNLHKVVRRTKIFRRDDPIHIVVHLEKNPHRELYSCRTQIYLPSKVLNVNTKEENPSLAINNAFSALSKQLDKLKYKLERHLGKRKSRVRTPNLKKGVKNGDF